MSRADSKKTSTSIVVTTYNKETELAITLNSLTGQTEKPNHVIIADDGSTEKTKNLINSFKNKLNIIHCWQEDKGYRRSSILNKAITKSPDDYIIFTDGDQILHKHFLKDHISCAKKGCCTLGTRSNITIKKPQHNITPPTTLQIVKLFIQGRITNEVRTQKKSTKSRLTGLMKAIRLPWATSAICDERATRGGNMAAWKTDLLNINGYDEAFIGWGFEDTDLTIRLKRIGIQLKQLRFKAICFHLDHPSPPPNLENEKFLKNERPTFCHNGIRKHNEHQNR